MNYRQWKKNYKKRYGYNPPIEDDKRKQAKLAAKAIKDISYNMPDMSRAAEQLSKNLAQAMSSVFRALGVAFNRAGQVCDDTADNLAEYAAEREVVKL